MATGIRILIADDHKVVREGLKAFIAPTPELSIIGEASSGIEAVKMEALLHPDVVLMDLVMPDMDGICATRAIKNQNPEAKILIISSFVEEEKVIEAIEAGASGYMLKDSLPEEIESAIFNIHKGESAFPSRIASILVKELNRRENVPQKEMALTERETDILKLMAQGLSNQKIADLLCLSVWTVRTYVTDILEKLQVENRTQATLVAIKEGLVNIEEQ